MKSKWISQIFTSKIAQRGGHVRRKILSIEKYASKVELLAEVKKRGFHIVETGDQWIIICNKGRIEIIQ